MRLSILCAAATASVACSGGTTDHTGATQTAPISTDTCPVTLTTEGLPGALYSVFGTSSADVYVVGADAGSGPQLHHFDGTAWSDLASGHSGDLWWGWNSGGDEVVFVGAGGAVLSYAPSTGTFTDQSVSVPEGTVFFGAWGSSVADVYAVGGNPMNGSGGVIWHRVDGVWSQVTGLPTEVGSGQVFKVWGDGPDDVWIVGANALLLQWDGTDWTVHPPPVSTTTTFFTVSGHAGVVSAVGGFGSGVVARYENGTWTDDSPGPDARAGGLNGVYASANGTVAVGTSGGLFERGDSWAAICEIPPTFLDFHGAYVDQDGGIWTVGGALTQQVDGIVAYIGDAPPPSIAP